MAEASIVIPFTTFGSGAKYTSFGSCNSGKTNCHGQDYDYVTNQVSSNWSLTVTGPDQEEYTFNTSNVEAYWDFRFILYEKEGSVDFTKNCHGYAFGVGDWPDDGPYGSGTIIVGWSGQACYVSAYTHEAQIAYSGTHSIKVKGAKIINPNEDPNSSLLIEAIIETKEKFRDSAIYKQSNPQGLPFIMNFFIHGPSPSVSLYKQAGGQ